MPKKYPKKESLSESTERSIPEYYKDIREGQAVYLVDKTSRRTGNVTE